MDSTNNNKILWSNFLWCHDFRIKYIYKSKKIWQYGFLKNKSIFDVIKKVDEIKVEEDEILILLDLKRAFDSVSHNKLIEQLEKDNEIKKLWVYQIIKIWMYLIQKSNLEMNNVQWKFNVGVPMGLKFSPLIFNLYLFYIFNDNKLNEILPFIVAYADDTTFKMKW